MSASLSITADLDTCQVTLTIGSQPGAPLLELDLEPDEALAVATSLLRAADEASGGLAVHAGQKKIIRS